jgi:hypothetical protein
MDKSYLLLILTIRRNEGLLAYWSSEALLLST